MHEVLIIDSGGANLASLQFALQRLGAKSQISADRALIAQAPRVILPGVGAATDAMRRLRSSGLDTLLPGLSCPVLGICLGMQLLFDRSEEGPCECLNILPGEVRRLRAQVGRPVPHMGWNQLKRLDEDPLLEGIADGDYVYFVHSYAAAVSEITSASADYGAPLAAVVRHRNFWGTQFHPERSAAAGARILNNFMRLP